MSVPEYEPKGYETDFVRADIKTAEENLDTKSIMMLGGIAVAIGVASGIRKIIGKVKN
jgi:hypothetical protein